MANSAHKKKKTELVPGTVIECKSGRYIAYYEHRMDIIANGENEKDAKKNLKKMYEVVRKYEDKEHEKASVKLPADFRTKSFKEKLNCL